MDDPKQFSHFFLKITAKTANWKKLSMLWDLMKLQLLINYLAILKIKHIFLLQDAF